MEGLTGYYFSEGNGIGISNGESHLQYIMLIIDRKYCYWEPRACVNSVFHRKVMSLNTPRHKLLKTTQGPVRYITCYMFSSVVDDP